MSAVKSYDFLSPPTQPGDLGTLGHYRVLDELGRGGMGFVFRAEDIKLRRAVALKVMNQKIAATPNSRRRFLHEARAMAAVHHDNVATIFEVGESNKTPFMAMEMLKGSTLETFNKTSARLGYEEVIDYARQIVRGLAAAHVKGIVHRDIKPANIWIEESGRIKILDFGLALASTPVDHLAGRGAVIGTPGYLSPEQARSEPLDDRSDLYSLGVVLYELCTGRLPIEAKSVSGQLISILAHRPTPINEINPEIPQPLCDLIHRLLRKEPRARPSSAQKVAEDLDRVEQECHAKSEVAQAINKLQLGLSEVVSKSAEESFFDTVEEMEQTIPDPLAVAPAAPVTVVPPTRPAAKIAAPAARPAWLDYWPIAAIVAVVLIALPFVTYLFSGSGRSDVPYVVATDPSSDAAAAPPAAPDSQAAYQASRKPVASEEPATPNRQSAAPQTPNNRQAGGKNRQQQGQAKQGQAKQGQAKRGAGQANRAGRPPAKSGPAAARKKEPDSPGGASVASTQSTDGGQPSPPSAPQPQPAPRSPASPPEPAPAPPTMEMEWTSISTADGRGADAMVQRGSVQRMGNNPSIGIAARNKIDANHSYLRFDLAPIEEIKQHVEAAGIVLTVLGGRDRVVGSVVRVHGIKDLGMWPEEKLEWRRSFSMQGLDSLPLLAELDVTDGDVAGEGRRAQLRITSPQFAKFISASAGDLVTFVLSGSGPDSEVVRFVSSESRTGEPPRLLVQIPKNPPPAEKKKPR